MTGSKKFYPTPRATDGKDGRGKTGNRTEAAAQKAGWTLPEVAKIDAWEELEIVETSQLTLFAEDTPANHLATPGSDKARKMTVISGRKLKGSWLPSGPVGVCLRMLLDTSAWASTRCFLTWKVKATPHGQLLFQLAPSTPRTEGTESGFWATPRTSDVASGRTLDDQGRRTSKSSDLVFGANLADQVNMWPTPTATEYKGARSKEAMERTGRNPLTNSLRDCVATGEEELEGKLNGSLNPTWVEWLMGYPSGWTDLKDSETPSSPKSPK
tara:strand:- start:61 stop:870 length:810 start_codon:yes stop_codon:yes gene_type:complete